MGKAYRRVWKKQTNKANSVCCNDWVKGWRPNHTKNGLSSSKDLVSDVVKKLDLDQGIVLEELEVMWSEVVGVNLGNHSSPIEFNRGTLIVKVSQPVMKFELERCKMTVLAKINFYEIGSDIQSVKFIL